jgi:glutaredoxin
MTWKKTFFCLMIFSSLWSLAMAQTDTLLLYTKPGCSNCHATKTDLDRNNIPYFEKTLDKIENGREVLDKLKKIGYKETIHLPVIFLNGKLRHPALQTDTGLQMVMLEDAVDSIKKMYRTNRIHLAIPQKSEVSKSSQIPTEESSCEADVKNSPTTVYYLVCSNYLDEKEAKEAMKRLFNAKYVDAGILELNGIYKVYLKYFTDKELADKELTKAKEIFKEAYLINIIQQ